MKRLPVLVFMIAAAASASAQESKTLSFDEALNMTMSNNPSMQATKFEEMAAKRERQAAIGLRMPSISVNGAYSYLGKDIALDLNDLKTPVKNGAGALLPSLDPEVAQAVSGLLTPILGQSWEYTLQKQSVGFIGGNVSLPIFLGGKINVANKAAKINEQAIHAQTAQTRNALVSELVERYFGYTLAAHVVTVRQQVVDGVKKHLNDAVALERNGMIASSERLYVEFKMVEAERDLQNAAMQLETIRAALGNTLGAITESSPATAMFILDQIESLEYYKQLAADYNPLLNQVELKKQLAKQNVRLQRADFFPQIVAAGGGTFYNYQVTKLLPRWAVGVGVNFKIFDGLNREYKYAAARQTAMRVEKLEDKANEDISVLIESLYTQMMNYRNQMTSIEASMAFAKEYLKMKNSAFLAGMGTSTDLVDAELNLAKVRIERMQAAYNYDVALAKLLEAAGVSDEFVNYIRRSNARQISFEE